MMAASRQMLDREPSEIEMLLPFHAAGTLSARDARRVEDALASDPDLARQYAVIQEEYAETISFNESLGAPSVRAMESRAMAMMCGNRSARAVGSAASDGDGGDPLSSNASGLNPQIRCPRACIAWWVRSTETPPAMNIPASESM